MTLTPKLRRYKKQISQQALRLEKHPDQIANWLDQFSGKEIPLVLPLLENLHYIGVARERMLLSRAMHRLTHRGLDRPRYCSIGPSYKSSSGKLRQFMKVNSIAADNVCVYEDIDKLDSSSYGDIVFIDDVIGTGKQIRRFLDTIKGAIAGRRVFIVYICGSTTSAERLESDLGVEIVLLDELPADFSAFSSGVFPRETDSAAARQLCSIYGASLEPAMPLGYRDSELLVAFHDFCPNNTLPIFWSVNSGWTPLFPTPQPGKTAKEPATSRQISAAIESQGKSNPAALQQQLPVVPSGPRVDWGNSSPVDTFFGRRRELRTLTKWITEDRCRLVSVWGMAGVGKSSLILRVGRQLVTRVPATPFGIEAVVWRRVVNPPSFRSFLIDILGAVSATNTGLGTGTEEELSARLLAELKRSRCLIILDNFESVIPSVEMSDAMRREAEKYNAFIALIGQSDHQSTVVLSSSEQPQPVALLEGRRRPVRSLELVGLDVRSVRSLFTTIGRFRADWDDWDKLTTYFAGNPLVLEAVAHEIIVVFNGNIREYLSSELAVPSSLTSRMARTFETLESDERLLLYWLALNRDPVDRSTLAGDLALRRTSSELVEILLRTRRKVRIEQDSDKLFLLPAMLNTVTARLVRDFVEDILNRTCKVLGDVAVLKVTSKDYVRDAQREAIAVRVLNGLSSSLGSTRSISRHIREALRSFMQSDEHRGGYLVGNCLNLLAVLEGELSELDVSGTLVREAYLRGIAVRDVNFSNCEFSGVAFDEAIGGLVSAAYRPDGGQFATGDMNGALHLWNSSSGKKVRTLEIHDGWIRSVAYSHDGRLVATAGEDSRVQVWDLEHEENVFVARGGGGRALAVALASNPTRVAFGGDDVNVSIVAMGTGAPPLRLPGHVGRVWALTFSSCGSFLGVGCGSGAVGVWNLTDPEPTCTWWNGLGRVRCLAFSPCDSTLAVGTEEGDVFLLGLATADVTQLGSHSAAVRSIGFSPDKRHLASGDRDGTIAIWNWPDRKKSRVFTRGSDCIRAISLHPQEPTLLAATDDGFCVWDWKAARPTMSITGGLNSVWALAAPTDNAHVFAGYEDGSIVKWDLSNKNEVAHSRQHASRIRALGLSLDNVTLASGGSDRRIFLGRSDLARAAFRRIPNEVPWIRAVALSPDGTKLACGGGADQVSIWDCRTLEVLSSFDTGGEVVQSLAFDADAHSIIVATNSGHVHRREISTGAVTATIQFEDGGLRALVKVDPNETVVIGSSTGLLALCSLSTGTVTHLWEAHSAGINALEVFAHNTSFASASNDGTVKLWEYVDVHAPLRLAATFALDSIPTTIARLKSDNRLAIGCVDGRVRIWDPISGSSDAGVAPRPIYAGSRISGVTGITEDQKRSLRLLGAVG